MPDNKHEPEVMSDRIAVIGISPRNGFFSQENITTLLGKTLAEHPRAVAMIADVPATANWVAFGYSPEKAWTKARLDGNNYRHRVERAALIGGFGSDRVSIPVWKSDVEPRAEYQKSYREIRTLYEANQAFRKAARETTEHFLSNAQKGWNDGAHVIKDMGKAIDTALEYLLAELGFIKSIPESFDVKTVVFAYPREFKIYDDYRNGRFDGITRPQLGMKVYG